MPSVDTSKLKDDDLYEITVNAVVDLGGKVMARPESQGIVVKGKIAKTLGDALVSAKPKSFSPNMQHAIKAATAKPAD